MAIEIIDRKVTQDQADKMQAPMELDFTALFKILEQDMLELTDGYEGDPEMFIKDICSLLSEQ